MLVLGIETSCDETGVGLYDRDKGLLADQLYSQAAMHSDYGGVVPELASRDQIRKLLPLIGKLFEDASCCKQDLNGIAYTRGPGLSGALLVGAMFAHSLAMALKIPVIGVHHMEGHLLAPMLDKEAPAFPFVALLVSGGHTQLVLAESFGKYSLLGESLDDAAGEAFDKVANMMRLGYPGGPAIEALAERYRPQDQEQSAPPLQFPRPMVNRPGLDFSFSGLKTHVLYTLEQYRGDQGQLPSTEVLAKIAYAFQEAVVQTVAIKCQRALKMTGLNTLVVAGGVAANKRLRQWLPHYLSRMGSVSLYYPQIKFCTDNGAMIAYAGCQRLLLGQGTSEVSIRPRWPLSDLAMEAESE